MTDPTPAGTPPPAAAPQLSPDGQWWWTGFEWVPAAAPPPPPAAAAPEPAPAPSVLGFSVLPVDPAAPSNLVTGERVLYRGQVHPVAALLPAASVAVLALLLFVSTARADVGIAFSMLLLVLFWLGLPLLVVGVVQLRTSDFAVTDKRVSIKVGVVRRRSLETLLPKVEGVEVSQGPLGSLLGYGTIVVNGVGGTREPFAGIKDPQRFRHAVQQEVAKLHP